MFYCPKPGKAITNKDFKPIKVYLHKEASYPVVLERMKEAVFRKCDESTSYFIADSTGSPVCKENGSVSMQDADGKTREIAWTIKTHLIITKKYPSTLHSFAWNVNVGVLFISSVSACMHACILISCCLATKF